ncbi:hypothetical protein Pmar_PMAR001918, partial [Perkinsus marinus ATCC 50983]
MIIIPVTHQSIQRDRALARAISQHNNNQYKNKKESNKITIGKAGCDIENILVFDLSWKKKRVDVDKDDD